MIRQRRSCGLVARTDLREFETAAEMFAHYSALRARMGRLRPPPKPKPKPVVLPPPLPPAEPPPSVLVRRSMIERVMYETCKYYTITRAALISTSRAQAVVIPRSVAMFLAREVLRDHTGSEVSLPVIGRVLHRDHTTVLHAIRHVTEQITIATKSYDPNIADAVAAIRNRLNGAKGAV